MTRNHVPRTEYEEILQRLEQSETHAAELQIQLEQSHSENEKLKNDLDTVNAHANQLQAELDDARAKLASTYEVLEQACAKIDQERLEFEKSLKKIRKTTEGEMKKNSELYATTLAMQETYVAQRQALDVKTNELKQLEKRLNKQTEEATNRINKLAVKLEQEKFITREIVQTGNAFSNKSKTKK